MSKYFKESEMACKCTRCRDKNNLGEEGISSKLYEVLDAIRESVGKPVRVNCAYRCPKHNKEVGGVPNSQHLYGIAADIAWDGMFDSDPVAIAEECGANGIGLYSTFIHVDVRGEKARWNG